MNDKEFNKNVNYVVKRIKSVLCTKKQEYSNSVDRLHGFKYAATFTKSTPKQALFGMMSKHLTSIADGIFDVIDFSQEKWDEKIVDTINYLILLRAIVIEEKGGKQ